MSIFDIIGFDSLAKKINKVRGNVDDVEVEEGVVSEKIPELSLNMNNEDLGKLTTGWKKTWEESKVYSEWVENGKENENYWRGKHYSQQVKLDKSRPHVDNVIFEALETYLPQVTRRNPDPMVMLAKSEEETPENLNYAKNIQKELAEIADELVFRLKLKKASRHWAIYLLGVVKVGWDLDRDIPTAKIIRPKKIILDPESTIDEDGYTGEFVGEHRKMQAGAMIDILKSIGGEEGADKIINDLAKSSENKKALATDIGFIEWWTNEYMCWTIDGQVLLKKKNPHWNYATEKEADLDENGVQQLNEAGTQLMEEVEGINQFSSPKKPYTFLSVFNLGKQPVDETSLIGQNLANQDVINKRDKQIDKNADSMNGGMVVSLERSGLTMPQAKGVTGALRKGGTIAIPTGSVNEAIQRMSAPGLPGDIYTQLLDMRNRVRDIFGTRGSSAAGLEGDKTVRGKFQAQNLDTDRIGGGFSEYLEQMADGVYNWFVQLLYVYNDNYLALPNRPKIKISVKEGSLLPKDTLTLANQAIELAAQNKMSLIDLYKSLDYPNPEELAANVWLQENAPEIMFAEDPRVKQVMEARQEAQAPEEKGPSESISFKDLPPAGQAQLAAKVGIELNPEAIAAHDAMVEEKKNKPLNNNKQ